MEEFEDIKNEMKRAEHLYFVSLKYTRTGDVIISLIDRLISAMELSIDFLFKIKDIKEVPDAPVQKAVQIKKAYQDDKIIGDMIDTYLMFRKIANSEKEVTGEFRRPLKVTVHIPDLEEPLELTIDSMQSYYEKTEKFVKHIGELLND